MCLLSLSLLQEPAPAALLAGMFVLGALLILLLVIILRHARKTPAERERRRRAMLHRRGRMGDALVTDVHDDLLIYNYSVAGVAYSASQDVSALADLLPEDRSGLVGPANLKYHAQNPANSMVVSEQWTGLRMRLREPEAARPEAKSA